eukprot:TRINITY_DN356_c4_g1_i1.p1 TRINITY_DN356_c4_g1~~TRINITY_DN356_c4_g1_i1.p1  ORF type:complete len:1793 (-),score=294.68 TRINITY_DN356_c4_g1_i1:47-4723(-)
MAQQEQVDLDNTESELVSFDESFGELYLNEVLLSHLQQKRSPTSPAHVVTFVGATHVGKSTMIRNLISHGKKAPAVAARGNYYPTTGNVHIYDTDVGYLNKSYPSNEVNLIDIEGSNSPSIPKYVLNTFTSQLKKLLNDPSLLERRKKAVNQHLPRFAYVISDVIVYIGEGNWGNTEYRDNVVSFANAAVENVASAIRPCIIIVHNKCNLHETMDVDIMTKKFLQLHEPEDNPVLTRLYDSVKCISIPDWYHDQTLFDQQINRFKNLIVELLHQQQQKRQRLGCLLTQTQWCELLRYVVNNFTSKSLRIGTFVGELVSPENSLAKNAFHFFNTIYDAKQRSILTPQKQFYLDCRDYAIEKLAVILLADLRQEINTSEFYCNGDDGKEKTSEQLAQFRSEVLDRQLSKWYHVLEVLCGFIQNRAPCCAIYPGVKDESGNPVLCTQEFGQHDAHRSPVMVFAPTKDDASIVERIIDGVKKFLDLKIPSVWNGEFYFGEGYTDDTLPFRSASEDDKQLLRTKIEELQQMDAKEFFQENLNIIKKATTSTRSNFEAGVLNINNKSGVAGKTQSDVKLTKSNSETKKHVPIPENVCFLCQINRCNRRIVPCGHSYCEYCTAKMTLLKSECPVCGDKIERVIVYELLSFKVGRVISSKGIMAVQNELSRVIDKPYKIVSLVGKIPPEFRGVMHTVKEQPFIAGGRLNPLRNFAFCMRYTGTRSCIYVEGGDKPEETIVLVHYAVDRYFDKPCIYPFLTSDVVILLDIGFVFRLPDGFPQHPFLIEPVYNKNRVKQPHRLDPELIMHYLSPPHTVATEEQIQQMSLVNQTSSKLVDHLNKTITSKNKIREMVIPKELMKPRSRYSLLEWCLAMKEIKSVSPNFIFHFVFGSESRLIKKRIELFVHTTIIKKSLNFFQIVEKKYNVIPILLSHLTLLNIIEVADKLGYEIPEIKENESPALIISDMITICRQYFVNIATSAKEYYSSILSFGRSTVKSDLNFSILDVNALHGEVAWINMLKNERLKTKNTKCVLTLRRILLFSWQLKKIAAQEGKNAVKELMECLSKNTQFCLLCMRETTDVVFPPLKPVCDHLVCNECWADIEWVDAHQPLVLDLVGKQSNSDDDNSDTELSSGPLQPTSSSSSTNTTTTNSSGSRTPGSTINRSHDIKKTPIRNSANLSSTTTPTVPSVSSSSTLQDSNNETDPQRTYTRSLLLFRCPICQEFLKERLMDYIYSDVSLSRAVERSIRIQCVLSEAEQGEVTLHKQINTREISNTEAIVGNVFRARYSNQVVAVKYFKPYFIGFEWSRLRREVAILGMCNHPHIISFIGAFIPDVKDSENPMWKDETNPIKPFIVFEYHPETLSDVVRSSNRKLPLQMTLMYSYQIATAILFLHSMNLVHRDIKPNNIVLSTDGKVAKLIDFGESRIVHGINNESLTKVGTPFYEAPEVTNGIYTDKVDSYSFGKMFYELVAKSINPSALAQRLFYEGPVETSFLPGCGDDILSLIIGCTLHINHSRPDFEVITKQLLDISQKLENTSTNNNNNNNNNATPPSSSDPSTPGNSDS